MQLNISNTKQEVAKKFADYLADLIHSKKRVHIALSGGSTPKIVFDELTNTYIDKIDWKKVHLFWGDERCVPPTDTESNYKMTAEHLLSKVPIPIENIHRIKGENQPKYEVKRYAKVLKNKLPEIEKLPQFDLVILGMGDDGHTASIFPHEIALWNSYKLCEVAEHPETGQKRITLTGKMINHAVAVVFLVTGEPKAEKVAEIINRKGACNNYPASLVAPKSGKLYWFLDQDAAAEITR